MKKTLFILGLIFLTFIIIGNKSEVVIPEESIRLRILANSNSDLDQVIKGEVKEKVENTLYNILLKSSGIGESRNIIKSNISSIENDVSSIFKKNNYNMSFNVDYGFHYFPSKEFRGITYNEGEYESLLITLGSGEGNNFWCVLFPPLCLLEAEDNNTTDIEYRSFVKELIQKYF